VTSTMVSTTNNTGHYTIVEGSRSQVYLAVGRVSTVVLVVIIIVGILRYRKRKLAGMRNYLLLFQSANQSEEPNMQLQKNKTSSVTAENTG
jgi:hypothetical protein